MFIVVISIILALSIPIATQLPRILLEQDNQDPDFAEDYHENDYVYPDLQDNDNIWLEMERKIQQLVVDKQDEYSSDFENIHDLRSLDHSKIRCVEQISGPFHTIPDSPEHAVYPARYHNISCVPERLGHHHQNHRSRPCDGYSEHKCVTVIKELPVFKKVDSARGNKKICWMPKKTLSVETGCKCSN